jgi:type II secretory pathway pseudopilin PulG
MITSTPRTNFASQRGFTLVEAIVATTLATLVLAGVMSSFLMIGRSSVNAARYSENEAQLRRALEEFGRDARRASNIQWTNDRCVTLEIGRGTSRITYGYDDAAGSETSRCFYRTVESSGVTGPKKILAREVAGLSFQRFKLEQPGVANAAANDLETKQLKVTLRAARRGAVTAEASQLALSASFILRNKRVSN